METLSALLAVWVRGICLLPVDYRSFDVFFVVSVNKICNKQSGLWFLNAMTLMWRQCNVVIQYQYSEAEWLN